MASLKLLLLLFLHIVFVHVHAATNPDTQPLLSFKSTSDPSSSKLSTWNSSTDPCTAWRGVTCLQNHVSRLVLENLDLHNSLSSLTSLTHLRVLSLKHNSLSGPLPDLSKLTSLKLLFLSHNNLSGPLPTSLTSLSHLYRLDLSHNSFSGEIPTTMIKHLTHLLTLRLEENQFSGSISALNLPNLQDFNISGNNLGGNIPATLSAFPESSFSKNPFLCGSPLSNNCSNAKPDNPTRPGAIASNPVQTTVTSSPANATLPITKPKNHHAGGKISRLALVAIIIGDVIVLAVVSLLLYCYSWKHSPNSKRAGKAGSHIREGEKIVYSSSPYPNPSQQSGFERGRMVFFEGAMRFELEDLLRASAEMLGKGGLGTAYKAVLEDGNVVAVKRLKEATIGGKREFEQQMEVLGRLRHDNVISLKAYYFARDEKLLVYDYMPNGNLFWLLHGTLIQFLLSLIYF